MKYSFNSSIEINIIFIHINTIHSYPENRICALSVCIWSVYRGGSHKLYVPAALAGLYIDVSSQMRSWIDSSRLLKCITCCPHLKTLRLFSVFLSLSFAHQPVLMKSNYCSRNKSLHPYRRDGHVPASLERFAGVTGRRAWFPVLVVWSVHRWTSHYIYGAYNYTCCNESQRRRLLLWLCLKHTAWARVNLMREPSEIIELSLKE